MSEEITQLVRIEEENPDLLHARESWRNRFRQKSLYRMEMKLKLREIQTQE